MLVDSTWTVKAPVHSPDIPDPTWRTRHLECWKCSKWVRRQVPQRRRMPRCGYGCTLSLWATPKLAYDPCKSSKVKPLFKIVSFPNQGTTQRLKPPSLGRKTYVINPDLAFVHVTHVPGFPSPIRTSSNRAHHMGNAWTRCQVSKCPVTAFTRQGPALPTACVERAKSGHPEHVALKNRSPGKKGAHEWAPW